MQGGALVHYVPQLLSIMVNSDLAWAKSAPPNHPYATMLSCPLVPGSGQQISISTI